ncbi:MAG: hypothetical protein IKH50_01685 [Oscillospiraceae bacterium]|nr:hypothetical protein [Oscillospiraceae bacterium]
MIYGQDITKETLRFTEEEKDTAQSFNCGNEVIDNYLKTKAYKDPQAVTFIVKDVNEDSLICYYSLSCSGLALDHGIGGKITIYPAVEIKMFAIDEKYQHTQFSEDPEEGNLSDYLFYDVISHIFKFTDEQCGADKIVLYSVPEALNFYSRNGFSTFEDYMKPSSDWFTDGCIPMYLDL